jgi:hypothetical protein
MDYCCCQYGLPGQQREEVLVELRILEKARLILLVFELVLFAIVRGRPLFRRRVVGMSVA